MNNYATILNKILEKRIIAILRVSSQDKAAKGIEALKRGGIQVIEVTMNTPGAVETIAKYAQDSELLLGAGTVLDEASCFQAIQHGANYIVTPNINESVIRCANRYQKPVVCGCMTPTEIMTALELGVNLIKAFPAETLGKRFIKDIKAPFPQVLIGPTGGVSLDNIKEWNAAGADIFGIAGEFSKLANEGTYEELTKTARKYVNAIQ